MLEQLALTDFKSFQHAVLDFDDFTLLIGANASGKSNAREALRILQGIGRGYSLAEILGEKWGLGGELEWRGPRGGALGAVRRGAESFNISSRFRTPQFPDETAEYGITVGVRDGVPHLVREHLTVGGRRFGYDTHPEGAPRPGDTPTLGQARVRTALRGAPRDKPFIKDRPVLAQVHDWGINSAEFLKRVDAVTTYFEAMRFLDLDPELARASSARGLVTLGDRGQNLSSVLAHITENEAQRVAVSGWIRALTPMDAVDIEFISDLNNQMLAVLVEGDGSRTPLSSASDGTVRFLAVIALLFSAHPPSLMLLEEIENGIHPHRIALLLELLQTNSPNVQIVATSHSPQLLEESWLASGAGAIAIVRNPTLGSVAASIKQFSSISAVLESGDAGSAAELMADGWFEDAISFELMSESSER